MFSVQHRWFLKNSCNFMLKIDLYSKKFIFSNLKYTSIWLHSCLTPLYIEDWHFKLDRNQFEKYEFPLNLGIFSVLHFSDYQEFICFEEYWTENITAYYFIKLDLTMMTLELFLKNYWKFVKLEIYNSKLVSTNFFHFFILFIFDIFINILLLIKM